MRSSDISGRVGVLSISMCRIFHFPISYTCIYVRDVRERVLGKGVFEFNFSSFCLPLHTWDGGDCLIEGERWNERNAVHIFFFFFFSIIFLKVMFSLIVWWVACCIDGCDVVF
jgi:hypothetical protein